MTLKITIKNPSRTAMRLKTCLKNSESFMFSGNTQVRDIVICLLSLYMFILINISILSVYSAKHFDLFVFIVRFIVQFVSAEGRLARSA